MRKIMVGEFKAQLSQVLEAVRTGESVVLCSGKRKEPIAALVPYAQFAAGVGGRPLGLLKGKASFRMREDFVMTEEELLGP